jgi:hypothetical protein
VRGSGFMHLELQSGATYMPQQIDVRDHRKCNDHDSFRIRSAAPDES